MNLLEEEFQEFETFLRDICMKIHHDWDKSRKARWYCKRCGKIRRPRGKK